MDQRIIKGKERHKVVGQLLMHLHEDYIKDVCLLANSLGGATDDFINQELNNFDGWIFITYSHENKYYLLCIDDIEISRKDGMSSPYAITYEIDKELNIIDK